MFPWYNQYFPFNQNIKDLIEHKGFPKGIDSYIQQAIEQSLKQFPPAMPFHDEAFNKAFDFARTKPKHSSQAQQQKREFRHHVFETHDDVYIQIPIEDKKMLGNIKIYHTSNKAMIEGLPEAYDEKQIIILPAIVKKKGAQATYKDGLLEIKIPKNIDYQFSEIHVEER